MSKANHYEAADYSWSSLARDVGQLYHFIDFYRTV